MDIPEQYRTYLSSSSRWLPAINWNVKLFGAHMQQVKPGWKVPEESHHAFELIHILEGTQLTVINQLRYELVQGDVLFIPPGYRHTNECAGERPLTYFSAHLNVDDLLFRQKMSRSAPFYFPAGTEENVKLTAGIMELVKLLERDGEYTTSDMFLIQSVLFGILSLLTEHVSAAGNLQISPTVHRYAASIAEALKKRFGHDHGHIDGEDPEAQELRIEDIAASLNISPGYAQEVFKEVYGISPRKYLSELKLHEAKQLIHQPDLALTSIAAMLGYSSLSHFSRQYKRWTGMSPRAYRKTLGMMQVFEE